jgi:hypothetical protein
MLSDQAHRCTHAGKVVHACRNADLKVANGASMVEGAKIALHFQCIRHVATLTKQRPARRDRKQGGQSTGDKTEHIERELQKARQPKPAGFLCLPAHWPSLRKGHYPGDISQPGAFCSSFLL